MRAPRLLSCLGSLALLCALGGAAQAQILDDTWFQLKVTGKGYLVDNATGEAAKESFKAVVYLHLEFDEPDAVAELGGGPPSQSYQYQIWSEIDGEWTMTDGGGLTLFGTDERLFFADQYWEYFTGEVAYFGGYHAGEFSQKLDKEGGLKKSGFKSLGAELIEGTETGAETAVGGYKSKGKQVSMEKLPFDPNPPMATSAPHNGAKPSRATAQDEG